MRQLVINDQTIVLVLNVKSFYQRICCEKAVA